MKISVTDLSSYSYCPRKLYLTMVLGKEEPPKDVLVKGTIRHMTYDMINKGEERIVKSIKECDIDSIFEIYKQSHSRFLKDSISANKDRLKGVGLNPSEVFKHAWPTIIAESRERAGILFNFIQKYEVFGDELWEMLTPKIISEIRLESADLNLVGRVDWLEKHKEEFVPVELKTGAIPTEGVWPSHKVQIGAYAMLIEDVLHAKVTKGFVDYLDSAAKQRREVRVNPFLKDEVLELIRKVQELISAKEAPKMCDNSNKCVSCGLKEACASLGK